jgi:hypothetical protein
MVSIAIRGQALPHDIAHVKVQVERCEEPVESPTSALGASNVFCGGLPTGCTNGAMPRDALFSSWYLPKPVDEIVGVARLRTV